MRPGFLPDRGNAGEKHHVLRLVRIESICDLLLVLMSVPHATKVFPVAERRRRPSVLRAQQYGNFGLYIQIV